ncbi:hypothetical protein DPMN_121133 [Dreissena polymorpha]|uniref:Uncharacterized protein n=1 Tax=Dreissena polymorpha TaxID=45954 RepID=A0A9D4GLV1_DREPO|nr:hypothetical protein DPMN_121133 [Dreissena polymorpha]
MKSMYCFWCGVQLPAAIAQPDSSIRGAVVGPDQLDIGQDLEGTLATAISFLLLKVPVLGFFQLWKKYNTKHIERVQNQAH